MKSILYYTQTHALILCAMSLSIWFCTGCETTKKALHELQPHRLHRWNQGPPPSNQGQFSISDDPESDDQTEMQDQPLLQDDSTSKQS